MHLDDIRHLLDYTAWANARVFEAALPLPEADLRRDVGGSFPSALATLAHIAVAEWLWLRRWQGNTPTAPPAWHADPTLASVRAALTDVEAERAAFLSGLAEADLDRRIAYRRLTGEPGEGRLGALLLHVANHSTYHRGQVVSQLRILGIAPPSTDLLVFDGLVR